jgi:hypothetical protein
VELHAIHAESGARDRQPIDPVSREVSLIGEVVDGEDAGHRHALPAQIARRQRARPVVEVQDVGFPVHARNTLGQLDRGQGQAGKAQIVVVPGYSLLVAIGAARPIEQILRDHDVDRQAVGRHDFAEFARRDLGDARQLGDDPHIGIGGEDGTIARKQHACVAHLAQGARQARRHFAQTTDLEKISNFRGHKEKAARFRSAPFVRYRFARNFAARHLRSPFPFTTMWRSKASSGTD